MTRGERNIAWIESHCRVPEGKDVGKPVKLRDWQKDKIIGIYDSPTDTAIISYGRKNGKTAFAAFLLLLHLVGPEAEPNSQLYSAAQSKDQAAVLFGLASKIVRMSPDLAEYVTVRDTVKQLHCQELGTLYAALSAEVSTSYGKSPIFLVHDELGQVQGPRSELYEALETACGAHDNPLSVIISTQAATDADLLSILIDDAKRGEDPNIKLWLYTADETLDPFDEKTIKQANPAYGDFLNKRYVAKKARDAKRMPSRENSYRNLILNQRISQVTPFIPRAIWEKGNHEIDPQVFVENPVYMGLDLSARNDLTALAYVTEDNDGIIHAKVEFFAPAQGLKDRANRDRAPYDMWAKQDLIHLTPGASVDYQSVAERLCQLTDEMNVVSIAFDRWRIDVLIKELERLGRELPLAPFGQGFKDMGPAVDATESALLNETLIHGNHPTLTWCAANAIVVKDPAGNRKLDKVKSTGRIDGLVALVMAMGQAEKTNDTDGLDAFLANPVMV